MSVALRKSRNTGVEGIPRCVDALFQGKTALGTAGELSVRAKDEILMRFKPRD